MNLFKKAYTVWMLHGRKVPAGTAGATTETRQSKKYYGTVRGKHVPLSADRGAAAKMLRKRLGDAELRSVGSVPP